MSEEVLLQTFNKVEHCIALCDSMEVDEIHGELLDIRNNLQEMLGDAVSPYAVEEQWEEDELLDLPHDLALEVHKDTMGGRE